MASAPPQEAAAAPAPDMLSGSETTSHASTLPAKGTFVRGTVEEVSEIAATVRLQSGHMGSLAWSNFSKRWQSPEDRMQQLAVGEHIWVIVMTTMPHVKLSTAALEVHPGDMLTSKSSLFSLLEQWDSSKDTHRLTFQEWRGRRELEKFLENQSPQSKKKASRRPRPTSPALWGLAPDPKPGRGDLVRGVVSSIKPFGIFVQLDRDRDGLIPISQVSKTYTEGSTLREVVSRGAEVVAAVRSDRLDNRPDEEDGDAGTSQDASTAPADGDSRRQQPVAGSSSGSAPRQQFVLSIRMLEAEEGLFKRSLEEYNTRAVQVHEGFQQRLVENNLKKASELGNKFREVVRDWRAKSFELPRGHIVKGKVVQVAPFGAFVHMEHGPTALVHEHSISHAKFKSVASMLKVGETIYGRVDSVPHTQGHRPDRDKDAESPGCYWMSIKELESSSPGFLVREPEKFWASAERKYKQQTLQPMSDKKPTLVMHASDIEVGALLGAIAHLEYVPWHLLAGRPNPGLLMGSRAPPLSEWTARYDGLAEQHEALRLQLQQQALDVLPGSLAAVLLQPVEPAAAQQQQDQAAEDAASSSSSSSREELPAWLQDMGSRHSIPGVLQDSWDSLRVRRKAAVSKLLMLRLKTAAVHTAQLARASSSSSSSSTSKLDPRQVEAELAAAAANIVTVARLLSGSAGRELVEEMYSVVHTLGLPLPQSVLESLVLWGWSLFQQAAHEGAAHLRASLVTDLLAAEGYQPPLEWCQEAFKLLYKPMVVQGEAHEVVHYFRLMHALGYTPSDSYWDRVLQQIYERGASTKGKMSDKQMGDLVDAVAAVYNRKKSTTQ